MFLHFFREKLFVLEPAWELLLVFKGTELQGWRIFAWRNRTNLVLLGAFGCQYSGNNKPANFFSQLKGKV